MDKATDAKTSIEETQRQAAKEREEKHESWQPRFFELRNDCYIPKFEYVGTAAACH